MFSSRPKYKYQIIQGCYHCKKVVSIDTVSDAFVLRVDKLWEHSCDYYDSKKRLMPITKKKMLFEIKAVEDTKEDEEVQYKRVV